MEEEKLQKEILSKSFPTDYQNFNYLEALTLKQSGDGNALLMQVMMKTKNTKLEEDHITMTERMT